MALGRSVTYCATNFSIDDFGVYDTLNNKTVNGVDNTIVSQLVHQREVLQ